jgi:hypothetical protein
MYFDFSISPTSGKHTEDKPPSAPIILSALNKYILKNKFCQLAARAGTTKPRAAQRGSDDHETTAQATG